MKRMTYWVAPVLLSLPILVLVSVPAWAESVVLNETMALQMVLDRNVIRDRIQAEIKLGKGVLAEAEKWSNPELSINRENLDQANSTEQSIALHQTFDFSGRRGLSIDAAENDLLAARRRAETTRRDIVADTRQRFYSALYQQQRQLAYQQTRNRLDKINRALSRRKKVGDVSRYDYQRVRAEHARLQARASVAQTDAYQSMQQLRALLGKQGDLFTTVDGKLLPQPYTELTRLLAKLEQQPALLQLKRTAEAMRLRQRAAEKFFPPVTLGAGVRQVDENGLSDEGVIFTASIPLPLFDTEQDKQLIYTARHMLASSDYQLAMDSARRTLESLWQRNQTLHKSAREYRSTAAKESGTLIKLAEAYYQTGQVGILELLDAYQTALESELTALELEFETRLAGIELDKLIGEVKP